MAFKVREQRSRVTAGKQEGGDRVLGGPQARNTNSVLGTFVPASPSVNENVQGKAAKRGGFEELGGCVRI